MYVKYKISLFFESFVFDLHLYFDRDIIESIMLHKVYSTAVFTPLIESPSKYQLILKQLNL